MDNVFQIKKKEEIDKEEIAKMLKDIGKAIKEGNALEKINDTIKKLTNYINTKPINEKELRVVRDKLNEVKNKIEEKESKADVLYFFEEIFENELKEKKEDEKKKVPVKIYKLELNEAEKSVLRQAFLCLEKQIDLGKTADLSGLEKLFKNAETERQFESVLKKLGMGGSVAKYYAKKIMKDTAFRNMLQHLPANPFAVMNEAQKKMQMFYFAYKPEEIGKAMEDLENLISYDEKVENKHMLNFIISRRYGNIYDMALRLGVKLEKNDDEVTVFTKILNKIKNDKLYAENLKVYEKAGKVPANASLKGLDNLDVVGRYLFLTKCYPEMVKTYGDITTFMDYLKSVQIPVQLQYSIFGEVVPELIKYQSLETVKNAISMISIFGDNQLRQRMWNTEKVVYEQGTKILKQIEKTNKDFLERLINESCYYQNTMASWKPGRAGEQIGKESFKQKTPVEVVIEKIRGFLSSYNPELQNKYDTLLRTQSVKNPEEAVRIFRELMSGKDLSFVNMQKGSFSVGIELDLSLFSKYLNELSVVEPMPSEFTYQSIRSNGNYSYRNEDRNGTPTKFGYLTTEYRMWGPSTNVSLFGTISENQNDQHITLGSTGENLYFGGKNINYRMSLYDFKQIEGYLDEFKEDQNAFVHLKYDDEKNEYALDIYKKDGGNYAKINTYKMSGDEAASIFASYLSSNVDARALFQNGKIKGLILGFQMDNIGLAVLENKENKVENKGQYSAVLAITGGQKKIGMRVYTDKESAKQLGVNVETQNILLRGAAGKEGEKNVYAVDYRQIVGNTRISVVASNHINQLLGIGVDSSNAYFLLDYFGRNVNDKNKKNARVITGFTINRGKPNELSADLWWYANKQNAIYRYSYANEIFAALQEIKAEREKLAKDIEKGNLDQILRKMSRLNYGYGYLETIIGKQLERAIRIRGKTFDGNRYEIDHIGGASDLLSYQHYGQKKSFRVSGSIGETPSLDFLMVKRGEQEIATLIGAEVLSVDDIAVLTGKYGYSTDPNKNEGYGIYSQATYSKDIKQIGVSRYNWYEKYDELKRMYNQLVFGAAKSNQLLDLSIAYGTTSTRFTQEGRKASTLYIIVSGAASEDEIKKKINSITSEIGINLSIDKFTGVRETLTGSLQSVELSGRDKNGRLINIVVNGYIGWEYK